MNELLKVYPEDGVVKTEIEKLFEKDPKILERKSFLTKRFLANNWASKITNSKELASFLRLLKCDKSNQLVIETNASTVNYLSVADGKINIFSDSELTIQETIEMLEHTPCANEFVLGDSVVKLKNIFISIDGVVTLSFIAQKTKLLLIVGRTGSGKSTIASRISNDYGIQQVKSFTTRPMRKGEDIKADHYFIKAEDVEKYKDDIAAYTKIGEYEYFVTWSVLREAPAWVYVIDPIGVKYFRQIMQEKGLEDEFELTTIYVMVSDDKRFQRLAERGDKPKYVLDRIKAEEAQFKAFEDAILEGEPAFVLRNDSTIDGVMKQFKKIAEKI